MISNEKIEKNKKKFLETNEKYNIFSKELQEFLGEDFFYVPASTSTDSYGCYLGGLLDHLLKVCKYCIQINDLLPEGVKQDSALVIKTVFLAQIGKTYLFKPTENEWYKKNGQLFEYRDSTEDPEIIALSVGERSIFYATTHGVKLSGEMYQAILFSDRESGNRSIRWLAEPLGHILKLGFELAVLEEKTAKKK